jgi:D-methionine transport system ATP-binding protein
MDLPTVGSVLVDGVATAALDYEGLRNHRVRTGYVFEDQGLLANQPLFENVALPLRYHHGAKLHEEDVQLRVRALLTELDIEAFAPFPPARVNPSARKRALLARALVLSPRLLLIDEPQAYLLPSEQEVFARACESRRKEAGMTIIQADHDGEFGPLVPERVVHLERGRVLAIGAPGEIKA